jgi:hypothetical protein
MSWQHYSPHLGGGGTVVRRRKLDPVPETQLCEGENRSIARPTSQLTGECPCFSVSVYIDGRKRKILFSSLQWYTDPDLSASLHTPLLRHNTTP